MNARSLVIAGALALLFRPSVAAPPPVEDLHIPPAAPGAHYYVDIEHAAADDDNPGTPEAPFRTLHGALQALQENLAETRFGSGTGPTARPSCCTAGPAKWVRSGSPPGPAMPA